MPGHTRAHGGLSAGLRRGAQWDSQQGARAFLWLWPVGGVGCGYLKEMSAPRLQAGQASGRRAVLATGG